MRGIQRSPRLEDLSKLGPDGLGDNEAMQRERTIGLGNILLLPFTLVLGLFVGMIAGAIYLPYLALGEVMRRAEERFVYLRGWTAWSESWTKKGKLGWYPIWAIWVFLWFASAFSWAPVLGAIIGPAFVVYALLVPHGVERSREYALRVAERIRNTRVEIRVTRDETQASR